MDYNLTKAEIEDVKFVMDKAGISFESAVSYLIREDWDTIIAASCASCEKAKEKAKARPYNFII